MADASPTPDDLLNRRGTSHEGLGQVVDELKALPFATVFPIRMWLKDRPWQLQWVRWFAFFAFYPLVMIRFADEGISLTTAAWAFGLYFAAIWALIFYFCLRPPALDLSTLAGTAAFTAFIGVALLLSAQQLPGISTLYAASDSANILGRAVGYVFGVGLLEEATKALPLWWRYIHKKTPTTPRACSFVGCVSGLAFGVAEAVNYSITYAVQQYRGELGYGDYLTVQFLRLISLPLLHALWAGTVGYFVGLAAAQPQRQRALLIVGLAAAATVHGLYDTFSGTWISTALGMLSLLAFVGYARAADMIEGALRASAIGDRRLMIEEPR